MYLKIIGCLFIMASAAGIGFLKAEELAERVRRLEDLKSMMLLLQGELRFHHASLAEGFENVAERVREPLKTFLTEKAERLGHRSGASFGEIWKEGTQTLLETTGFRAADAELLDNLQRSLGYLDLELQTEALNQTIFRTGEAVLAAKEEQKAKSRLYRTMGVTAGAILALLII